MIGWTVFAVYVVGFLVTSRKLVGTIVERLAPYPDHGDRLMGRMLAILVGMVWPGVLLGLLATGREVKTPTEIRDEAQEREREQKRRIRDLERELRIDRDRRA